MRFTAERPRVAIRKRPETGSDQFAFLEEGDEIVASDVFIQQGIEWVKLARGSMATRPQDRQVPLDLHEDGYVATSDPDGALLRKHDNGKQILVEMKEEGALSKAEIQEILQRSSDPGLLLPLESKYWSKQQLEMYVMSAGVIRPRWCSMPDERLMANTNMGQEEIARAMSQAAVWMAGADAVIIGSGAGMGVDSGLGTFRGGCRGVWPGLEAIGLAYEEICHPRWFKDEPHLGWAFWNHCHMAYQATIPHEGYAHLRELGQRCPLGYFSFTSNIDGHWISSGMTPDKVLEVHGAVRWLQCSSPCCPDVWKAPKDFSLIEDPITHRVRGVLPTCPKCQAIARPNVQMFGGDSAFSGARRASQSSRYHAWLQALEGRPDRNSLRVACIEVGCGLTVPTVRKEIESVMRRFPGARLIRLNPENPGMAPEFADRGASLPLSASSAIDELSKQVKVEEPQVTYIMFGSSGGCEIRAPFGTSLGRLLRLAQAEDMKVELKQDTMALCRLSVTSLPISLDGSVPAGLFHNVKAAEGPSLQVTAALWVNAKFASSKNEHNLNKSLLQRLHQVNSLLDSLNLLFAEPQYQKEARCCTDKKALLQMVQNVQHKVLPNFGIPASERSTAIMTAFIEPLSHMPEVQAKIGRSMDLSFIKELQTKAKTPTGTREISEAKSQVVGALVPAVALAARAAAVAAATAAPAAAVAAASTAAATALPAITSVAKAPMAAPVPTLRATPISVVLTRLSTIEDAEPERLQLALMSTSSVAEVRQKVAELLGLDDKEARRLKLLKRRKHGGFVTSEDTDLVAKEMYLHQP